MCKETNRGKAFCWTLNQFFFRGSAFLTTESELANMFGI